jgi:predicted nucleic acid-binding protein
MKTKLVVDASVWIKLMDGSREEVEIIEDLLRLVNNREVEVISPNLACLEILNVLIRSKKTSAERGTEFLKRLEFVGVEFVVTKMEDLSRAAALMIKYDLTAYDGCYLGLATENGVKLLTADKKLLATPLGISLSQLEKLLQV